MSFTTNVVKRVFPNGLTLLVERVPNMSVVAVVTHVKAGYFDEPDEWVGISHVLEHMFFKGTTRRGPGDLARETQLLGGYVNAGTIYDKTVYYAVLPSAEGRLERALDVQADALRNSVIDAGELSRELEVIIQEAKRKNDSPPAVASESLYALLFQVHRMRRWRIGTEAGLRRLTRDDVRQYYETRYTPDRVIVAMAGDLDVQRALALGERQYGGWTRPAKEVLGSPAEPNGVKPVLEVLHGDVERPLARLGWRTVGTLDPDAAALDVAAGIIGSGRGSRLYRGVRLPGLVDSVGAGHYTPTEVGVFEIGLQGDDTRLDDAVARSLDLVASLRDEGPSAEEVDRVRALTAAHWARRLEGADGRATALCEAEALGDYALVDVLYERAMEVGTDDVQRVATRYLDPGEVVGLCYLPRGGGTRFAGAWPPPVSGNGAGRLAPIAVRSTTAEAKRPGMRLIEHRGGVRRWSGPGVDFLIKSKPGTGIVTLGLHVLGARSLETRDVSGISWLAARGALRGAGGMRGEDLAQAAEVLGGALGADVGTESLGWWITVQAPYVAEAARLLRIVALEPTLDPDAVILERAQQVGDARSMRDDMFRYPVQQVLAQAFPDDPYGLPAMGTPESVEALEPEQVRDWAGTLREQRAVVVAVGDHASDELGAALEPLAAWPARHAAAPGDAPAPWAARRTGEDRAKAQSALAMAFPAMPYGAPERPAAHVLSGLLSGMAGRLFDELRERRSLAYTVAALPWLARRAGAFVTYIATSPERESEARDAMLAELGRVVKEPPSDDELNRARNYAGGVTELRRQHGRAVADEILNGWIYGHLDELPDEADRLRRVSREELVEAAERMFDPERRAEYVVRGRV